jgi:hypothetical protein
VPKNYSKAAEWYWKGAKTGESVAMNVTGRFKIGHLWALQNRPGYKGILHPVLPIITTLRGRSSVLLAEFPFPGELSRRIPSNPAAA